MHGLNISKEEENREIVFGHVWRGMGAMARSETRKLLFHPEGRSLYFNLENDPFELTNLYDHPEYQEEIEQFKKSIMEWQGQTKLGDTFVDKNAPQIKQPNVPSSDGSHREEIIAYYQKMMKSDG
jgi:hypothetical protein